MRKRAGRISKVALLAGLVLTATASQASAGTVSLGKVDGVDFIVYRAAAGEANSLSVTASRGGVQLTDPAGISVGTGCSRPDPANTSRAVCAIVGTRPLSASLGDGDDTLAPLASAVDYGEIDGGTGNDTLNGGAGEDVLTGGPGDDRLFGFQRDDTFLSGRLDGADILKGGAGIGDAVDYSDRTADLRVDLDGVADDGQAGERDNVDPETEDVFAGSGDDRISSLNAPSTVRGGSGADTLLGGVNTDELLGGPGNDRLDGGRGSDRVEGDSGNDRLKGGPGGDLLRGGRGNDVLRARDGFVDSTSCGTGTDTVIVDRVDMAFSPCERVRRRGPALVAPIGIEALPDGFALFASGIFERNVAELQLGCPRDSRRSCGGTATLVRKGRNIGRTGFSIRRADSRQLDIRVAARTARLVRRRGKVNAKLVLRTIDSAGNAVRLTVPFTLYDEVPTL